MTLKEKAVAKEAQSNPNTEITQLKAQVKRLEEENANIQAILREVCEKLDIEIEE